ncbi:hypothetical protein JRQ81_009413 [Phrynocephalus forsythii]|uniref:BZIP domain-containing protein n=1 Tax=Phrynocephalus forsythii TaxID=171643 RepID=A0A9Q0XD34_9SAUR|nr:hypothetical protein JRQ81_009413 [Phrynocephalus forsythii]
MVQPTIMGASPGVPPYPRPYHCPHYGAGMRPRVIRTAGLNLMPRRRHSEHLTPEEEERRRLRRERNKLAAAKCRNRRKELTDTLQAETDQLEAEQSGLRKEIEELQKQKERLELVLAAHRPACKVREAAEKEDRGQPPAAPAEPPAREGSPPGPSAAPRRAAPVPPSITLLPSSSSSSSNLEPDALHTPRCCPPLPSPPSRPAWSSLTRPRVTPTGLRGPGSPRSPAPPPTGAAAAAAGPLLRLAQFPHLAGPLSGEEPPKNDPLSRLTPGSGGQPLPPSPPR